ncbi:MAG: GDSL-type esterase/lipase family protein [Oscillospiraceae bacterium]
MRKRSVFFLALACIGVFAFAAGIAISGKMDSIQLPFFKKEPVADYTQPAPASDPVEDSFFAHSAFIGHSLIEGFAGNSGLTGPDFYAETGFSIHSSMNYDSFELPDGSYGRLKTGLSMASYDKVYIMFGINEISMGTTAFSRDMSAMIDLVREYQPEATLYILAVTPTTRYESETTVFSRDNIMGYNEALQTLCGEKECIFVDLFSCFADENGYLPDEKSSDGIHFYSEPYVEMLQYLKTHTTPFLSD